MKSLATVPARGSALNMALAALLPGSSSGRGAALHQVRDPYDDRSHEPLMGWIDWLRYVLTPLLIAVLGATIATRNARKTPHERLKNLVDIHDKMPADLDRDNVVETAIARELVNFDRRIGADQRGTWQGLKERAAQIPQATILGVGVAVLVVAVTALGFAVFASTADESVWNALPTVLGAAVTFLAAAIAFRATRDERTEGRDEQLAATIAVQLRPSLNRRLVHSLAAGHTVVAKMNHEAQNLMDLLVSHGLVERVDSGGEPSPVGYIATPRGVQILRRAAVQDETDDPDEEPPTS